MYLAHHELEGDIIVIIIIVIIIITFIVSSLPLLNLVMPTNSVPCKLQLHTLVTMSLAGTLGCVDVTRCLVEIS